MREPVGVGLLGCGTVGSALVELLAADPGAIEARAGVPLRLVRVAVRDAVRPRLETLPPEVVTADPLEVVTNPGVDVVVELMGGQEPAGELIRKALEAGKSVVTANKELLAERGAELAGVAAEAGIDLLYEAAVGGAIPLVRPLRESLAGERIHRVMGIVNGTTNYILTRMGEEGASYADALAEAQALGYAEANPDADVEGRDAAAKAAILATLAFGAEVVVSDVHREGITGLDVADIAFARRVGFEVKLLAIAEQLPEEGQPPLVAVRVHPAMVPKEHPLASVRGSFNAVFVEGEVVGELMLYGPGAGGRPTAAAVLGDLIDAAHNLRSGGGGRAVARGRARVRPMAELTSRYYLSLEVLDRPGVLASVARIFGDQGVSIRSMEQLGLGGEARLIFMTHTAREADVQATLEALSQLDAVERIGGVLRLVGTEAE
ncbi:MAG TPA: homoserine dehydrogenase [Acidimicrobiales bacterium]|nr:homoserine dehydrogenase [Acidimicrobiales bacterium]